MGAGETRMYKLVILVGPLEDWTAFDEAWAEFLHLAESMPGLQREATSRVDTVLFGSAPFALIHELFFDSLDDAKKAMAAPEGRAAGTLLQEISQGKVTLYLADHKEDNVENILKYKNAPKSNAEENQGVPEV
jgi:uncharacterized protein (TIGR02118 family)